ncbi:hypothetical protein BX616_008529 [Lobosporangium transversale]|uniref:Uncharacterized protein n=1 Tax=Lobosporangium transversale TaxID=64571 RepID=A0A1Y2GQ52_9FUNG|nr:hypothetical protein BCR41DRAFT_370148 [Lobosporangium transversale]KAF9914324.1 hypothetical protein BX616_008529 [Lobosporangium transversale]ORZ18347.1 hypothetical protein BCR41DRAFT_370148 [Lobosporangium transversale]|eukprot:XP_021882142.1 hypothetical protein BCR41DRAFT_370148 [Lobosporangium transversale]
MSSSINQHEEGHGIDRHDHLLLDHSLSAEDLALRLEQLQLELEQERAKSSRGRGSRREQPSSSVSHPQQQRPHRLFGVPIEIDADLHKRAQVTLNEILERLERQKMESDPFAYNNNNIIPGIEDNGFGRVRHTHKLNPKLLERRDLSHAQTLRQSHGNANLRHS